MTETRTTQFEGARSRLFALAYRALGSRCDAEDVVQETFLRWQRAPSDVASPTAWLMTAASRLSLDLLKSARRRREEYVGVWLPEPLTGTTSPVDPVELSESISTAFLHLLESLSPEERVAFLLREVFGVEYPEVARTLETSEASCRQLVSRARKYVRARRPRSVIQPEQHRAAIRKFFNAVAGGDLAGLVQLMREDATSWSDGGGKASAAINPIRGADRIARFFVGLHNKSPNGLDRHIADAGGVPSLWVLDGNRVVTLITLDFDDSGRIASIFIMRNPDKLPPFPI